MSFDLTFFDPLLVPNTEEEFYNWLKVSEEDGSGIVDPKDMSKNLNAWYNEVKVKYRSFERLGCCQ